jgi:hypothetical protein
MKFPVDLLQIPKIEIDNNISITVYKANELFNEKNEVVYPISIVYPNKERRIVNDRHINLLLYKYHYTLIKDLNKLFGQCVVRGHSAFVCELCGHAIYTTENALEKHEEMCAHKLKNQSYTLAEPKKIVFENYQFTMISPFIIYADFESYFELNHSKADTKSNKFLKLHKPMGFAFKTVYKSSLAADHLADAYFGCSDIEMYLGPEADKVFTERLVKEARRIGELLSNIKPIEISGKEEMEFEKAKACFICKGGFINSDPNKRKVQDHDHLTGRYRGNK